MFMGNGILFLTGGTYCARLQSLNIFIFFFVRRFVPQKEVKFFSISCGSCHKTMIYRESVDYYLCAMCTMSYIKNENVIF